jgi:predicted ArsR family transcriptional regulator
MMKTTRQQIIDLFSIHEIMTVADISLALHITSANTRHHLAILAKEGIVESVGIRHRSSRGRPQTLFQLTRHYLEHNLDRLSHHLLQFILQNSDEGFIQSMLQSIAFNQVKAQDESSSNQDDRLSLNQRLQKTVQVMNSLHYRSKWEAHTSGPKVILGHCPYSAIIHAHPELCRLDSIILENLVKTPVIQTSKLATSSQGLLFCEFQLKLPQNK